MGEEAACVPLARQLTFTPMSEDEEEFAMSSPHHTRSGRVYTGSASSRRRRGKRKLVREVEGDIADCEEELEERDRLPAVERCLRTGYRATVQMPSSPINSSSCLASPVCPASPTFGINHQASPKLARSFAFPSSPSFESLRVPGTMVMDSNNAGSRAPTMSRLSLLESPNSSCSVRTPKSTGRGRIRSKLLFTFQGECTRPTLCASPLPQGNEEPANINPFTPAPPPMRARESSQSDLSDCPFEGGDSSQEKQPKTKKVRVSDMNIFRYQDEFLELSRLASGSFGSVVKARHRLDGVVYAVKITKKRPKRNSRDEKVALNEVFVLAAMMKHRHVVRYFNAWVENGHLHIQTEFCEGGSLEAKVDVCIESNMRFSDLELRKILIQVTRGLQYLHKKKLAHLDIKPANILIAFCEPEDVAASPVVPFRLSPDSGAASQGDGDGAFGQTATTYGPTPDTVRYKIGDLGHVVAWSKEEACGEEGDCRYMAPEFMRMGGVAGPQLPKADIFSLGLSIYEVARLQRLPVNSDEGSDFSSLREGRLATIADYPKDLMVLLRTLTQLEPSSRPSADRLLKNPSLDPSAIKSMSQLKRELKEEREKVFDLEIKLRGVHAPAAPGRMVGRGASRSASTIF